MPRSGIGVPRALERATRDTSGFPRRNPNMWFMMYRPAEVKALGAVDGPFTETKELFGGEPPQDPE
jgi:hypothetical protein